MISIAPGRKLGESVSHLRHVADFSPHFAAAFDVARLQLVGRFE
jgi:hypothetical protein